MLDKELQQSLDILKKGQLLLYPTDTVWGIGCDATNFEAVQKIFKLKQRDDQKALICLVNDVTHLNYCIEEVPKVAYDIIKYSTKPTTIIYDNPLRVAENLIAPDNTLAIRIVDNGFCGKLLKTFKKPLVSTSANISGQPTPQSFSEIENPILKGVDYVVDLERQNKSIQPSTIIRIKTNGEVKIIRS